MLRVVSSTLEQKFKELQLSSEDIVLETAEMLKKRYDANMRAVLDKIALWWINYDIDNLQEAQAHYPELLNELEGILTPHLEEQLEGMTELFSEVYIFNYDYACKTLQIEQEPDHDALVILALAVIGIAWADDGLTYRERMTLRMDKLKDSIHSIVLRCATLGYGTRRMLAQVEAEMSKPRYRGTNMLVDESNHFANEAVRNASEADFDGYEISEVLDMKTCDLCRTMHGKRFTWEEYEVGLTAPYFHNSCRGRIIPIHKY